MARRARGRLPVGVRTVGELAGPGVGGPTGRGCVASQGECRRQGDLRMESRTSSRNAPRISGAPAGNRMSNRGEGVGQDDERKRTRKNFPSAERISVDGDEPTAKTGPRSGRSTRVDLARWARSPKSIPHRTAIRRARTRSLQNSPLQSPPGAIRALGPYASRSRPKRISTSAGSSARCSATSSAAVEPSPCCSPARTLTSCCPLQGCRAAKLISRRRQIVR